MAIMLDSRLTQQEFGALIGVSRQAVGDLATRGIIDMNQTAQEMLHSYCSHLREIAAGRMAAGELNLADERARLAKEQADRVAMQNAVTREELVSVIVIEEVLTRAAARVAGIFDSIPGTIRRRYPNLPAGAIEQIAAEIVKVRNIVAGMSLADICDDGVGDDAAP